LLRSPPNFNNLPYLDPVFGLHRTYRFQHPGAGDIVADRGFDNPFYIIKRTAESLRRWDGVFGNINAEYTAADWLRVNYTLGADYSNDERLEGCPISSSDVCFAGRVIEGKLVNYQIDHNLSATAKYQLNPNIAGTVTARPEPEQPQFPAARQRGPDADHGEAVQGVEHGVARHSVRRADDHSQRRLLRTGDARSVRSAVSDSGVANDGSSTFGVQNRRSWFPKGSLAWTFTKVTVSGRG